MSQGFRAPSFPLGLVSTPTPKAGFRGLLAFWLGGAENGSGGPPPGTDLGEYETTFRSHGRR